MTLKCINPSDLPPQQTYTQVVVATGSKAVHGEDPDGSRAPFRSNQCFSRRATQSATGSPLLMSV